MQPRTRTAQRWNAAPGKFSRKSRLLPAALVLVASVTLAACGNGASSSEGNEDPDFGTIPDVGKVETDPDLVALLPDRYDGELQAAANIPHPPFIDFKSEGVTDEFTGVDYDLMTAIGAKLGVTVTYNVQPFDGLIPGLEAGKFDLITGIADLKERQQTVTFIDNSKTGAAILVRPDEDSVAVPEDLCGLKVGAVKASTLKTLLDEFNENVCTMPQIDIIEYPDDTATTEGLVSRATDAMLLPKVTGLMLAAARPDSVKAVEDPDEPNGYKANPNGIAVLNDHEDLAMAIQAALQSLIDEGTYAEIYEKWGLGPIGVESAVINGAIN